MPYISDELRGRLVPKCRAKPLNPGELSFQVACLIDEYVRMHSLSYSTCNDVVGALDGVKHEFQRRIVDPYEAKKMTSNGEVFLSATAQLKVAM